MCVRVCMHAHVRVRACMRMLASMCVCVHLFLVRSGRDCDNSQNNMVSGSPFLFCFSFRKGYVGVQPD